ncbi:MAG: DUF2877 domain-containing protein [Coprothermobacterota bacterium]|nr:DUF2877 domain-containing protein [Coprothermobacterota bacterium]
MGDRLPNGRFTLLAAFSHVLDYINDAGEVVGLVDSLVGPGPNQIVLSDIGPRWRWIQITDDTLLLEETAQSLFGVPRYCSTLCIAGENSETLARNLAGLHEWLAETSVGNGTARLLVDPESVVRVTAAERALLDQYRQGLALVWQALEQGSSVKAGVTLLSGLGPGLTPTGDDLLAGVLCALFLAERMGLRATKESRTEILQTCGDTNPISRTMLQLIGEGYFLPAIKGLLQALPAATWEEAKQQARDLCSMGATSGLDLAVGLILTCQRLNRPNSAKV